MDSAVLAFNNALSYHLSGLEHGDSSALHQALVYYSHSHSIVVHESRILQHTALLILFYWLRRSVITWLLFTGTPGNMGKLDF